MGLPWVHWGQRGSADRYRMGGAPLSSLSTLRAFQTYSAVERPSSVEIQPIPKHNR